MGFSLPEALVALVILGLMVAQLAGVMSEFVRTATLSKAAAASAAARIESLDRSFAAPPADAPEGKPCRFDAIARRCT